MAFVVRICLTIPVPRQILESDNILLYQEGGIILTDFTLLSAEVEAVSPRLGSTRVPMKNDGIGFMVSLRLNGMQKPVLAWRMSV